MSWCPAPNLPHHRVYGYKGGIGVCTGVVSIHWTGHTGLGPLKGPFQLRLFHNSVQGKEQVRSCDGDSCGWGSETPVFPVQLWQVGNQSLKCFFVLLWSKSFLSPNPKPVTNHISTKEGKGGLCWHFCGDHCLFS